MSYLYAYRVIQGSELPPGLQGRASRSAFARLEINSDEQMVEDELCQSTRAQGSMLHFRKAWVGPESGDLTVGYREVFPKTIFLFFKI
jgi:hypothetical protein